MFDFGSGLSLTKHTDALRSVKSLNTLFLEDIHEVPVEEGVNDIDGGWAFVIFGTSVLGHIFVFGVSQSSGIMYTAILEYNLGSSEALTSIPFAFTFSFVHLLSPISHWSQTTFGSRKTIFVGCSLSTVGLIGSSFITNVPQLIVTYGILSGFGWALVYTVLVNHLEDFFVVYRKIVTMAVSVGTGISSFIYPYILNALIIRFGWRGTFLILGGLNLNLLICVASFKRNKFTEKLKSEDEKRDLGKNTSTTVTSGSIFNGRSHDLMRNDLKFSIDLLSQRPSVVRFAVPNKPAGYRRRRFISFLDEISCRNLRFQIILIAHFFITFAPSACVMQLSNYIASLNYSQSTIALVVSLYGLSNALNRIALSVFAYFIPWGVCTMFEIVVFSYGIFAIFIAFTKDFIPLVAMSVCLGLTSAWFIMTPEIIFLTVGRARFNKAFSVMLVMCGLGNLVAPPLSSLVYQMTSSYTITFIFIGIISIIGGLCALPIWIDHTCK